MAKFHDLSEQDRIQYVKDAFVDIIEKLAAEPSKLNEYIKLDKPKHLVPASEACKDSMNEEEKASVAKRNLALKEKVELENLKLDNDYRAKEHAHSTITKFISGLKKKEHCFCGSCFDVSLTSSAIPPEFEVIIDAARKDAEERNY